MPPSFALLKVKLKTGKKKITKKKRKWNPSEILCNLTLH